MIHTHSFIYENLHSSTSGLVIQSPQNPCRPIFVSMRQGRVEISNFNNYEFKYRVYSSCNGLMVGFSLRDLKSIYILNPVTNQNFQVPPFHHSVQRRAICIAYSPVSMEYKVVIAHKSNSEHDYEPYIFTLGVDESWRPMNTQCLSLQARNLFGRAPLVTQGFIHWAMLSYHVVTMNVETEILTETPVPLPPKVGGGEKRYTFYMPSGNDRLSLFIACGGFSWDVWEMKPETGEWRKLYNIDLEAQMSKLQQLGYENVESLRPTIWLHYQEAFFFNINGTCKNYSRESDPNMYYHLGSRDIEILNIHKYYRPISVLIPHTNSLVWMARS